jgi:hypothetical protein
MTDDGLGHYWASTLKGTIADIAATELVKRRFYAPPGELPSRR